MAVFALGANTLFAWVCESAMYVHTRNNVVAFIFQVI
jgi:hypothetical protein